MSYFNVCTIKYILFAVFTAVFTIVADARPLYTNKTNNTFALVLCGNLNQAISALKQKEIIDHIIGAVWLEQNCVSIDPCAETSSNIDFETGLPLKTSKGVWLSGNSSALQLPHAEGAILAAKEGLAAENSYSLEYARVPEGLLLEACAPDYDLLRREGTLACNENTIVVITTDSENLACPGTQPHTLLDCVKPLQFDATVQTLHWRPPSETMHLGTGTWNDVCSVQIGVPEQSPLVKNMCTVLSQYTLKLPVAAAYGSTSLIKFDFLPNYACHRDAPDNHRQILSTPAAPNKIVNCPTISNGQAQRSDSYTCTILCDAGYVLEENKCVSECQKSGFSQESCPTNYFATAQCQQGSITLYNCSLCASVPGFGIQVPVPGVDDVFACHYTPCAPGFHSNGLACEACSENYFSNTSQAIACTSCDTVNTGMYQVASAQTTCSSCLWNVSVEAKMSCPAGTSYVHDFQRLLQLFALYSSDHNDQPQDYLQDICRRGYACLPCEPGYYENERLCIACPFASYQTNFGAQECNMCAAGQNTTALASTRSSDCVCREGYE